MRRLYWDALVPALQQLPPAQGLALAWHLSERLARPRAPIVQAIGAAMPDLPASARESLATQRQALRLRAHLERAIFPRLTAAHLAEWVAFDGRAHLDAALASGRGAVLAATHFGAHGWPPVALALAGVRAHVQTLMRPDAALPPDAAWSQARRRALEDGLPIPYLRNPPDDDLLAPLDVGDAVIVTADCRVPDEIAGDRRVAPLLGRPAAWPRQAFELAERSGAALLAYFPDSERRHRLRIVPLTGPDPQSAFIRIYESELRARPGQWQFWGEWGRLGA